HRIKEQTVEILNRKHQGGNTGVTVELSKADLHLVENHAQSAITRAGAMLESQLFLLSTTVSLAPFLGLLGTVWGILLTFSELQNHVEGSSNQAMMSGLSMALATTVLGLLVAIPALIGYNFLRHSIRDFTVEMEAFATDILSAIEMQYRTE
ncbi:MAG: MotA/TolQ/ExbB proton channel family protein, partial [Chlamydiia bacterium]|nr:MotA/TolQ/ExbB proton channel family protein [Chlamydiia bacterium]